MDDRIDQYLEGSVGRDALDEGERGEADTAARAVIAMRAFMLARPAPDVTGAVMQRLGNFSRTNPPRRAGALAALWQQLWTPRPVSIRPAYALLTAGACLVIVLFLVPSDLRSRSGERPGTDAASRVLVQFRLETEAMHVQLAGSFTNWQPAYELHEMAPGVWTITVPLPQGVHDYAFVVNGQQWKPDPYAPSIQDGFGGTNSRLTLLLPETPRT
jgi:hypothetical protein